MAFTTFPLPSNIDRYCPLGAVVDYWQLIPLHSWWPVALALVTLVELVTIWVRRDDRSLSSVLTPTMSRTHDDIGRRDQKAAGQRAAEQRAAEKTA